MRILWDHTTDDTAEVLASGNGFKDYQDTNILVDPGSAGGTGDILLRPLAQFQGNIRYYSVVR